MAGSIIDGKTVNGVVSSYMGVWLLYAGLLAGAFVVIAFASKKSAAESVK